jgi:hypothetical protein
VGRRHQAKLAYARKAGVGVQYRFNRYSYDRGILVSELGGQVTFKGGQACLSFRF